MSPSRTRSASSTCTALMALGLCRLSARYLARPGGPDRASYRKTSSNSAVIARRHRTAPGGRSRILGERPVERRAAHAAAGCSQHIVNHSANPEHECRRIAWTSTTRATHGPFLGTVPVGAAPSRVMPSQCIGMVASSSRMMGCGAVPACSSRAAGIAGRGPEPQHRSAPGRSTPRSRACAAVPPTGTRGPGPDRQAGPTAPCRRGWPTWDRLPAPAVPSCRELCQPVCGRTTASCRYSAHHRGGHPANRRTQRRRSPESPSRRHVPKAHRAAGPIEAPRPSDGCWHARVADATTPWSTDTPSDHQAAVAILEAGHHVDTGDRLAVPPVRRRR